MIEQAYITATEAIYLIATGQKVTPDEAWDAAKTNIIQWGVGNIPVLIADIKKLQNGWTEKTEQEISALPADDKFNYQCELGGIKNAERICTENNLTHSQAIDELNQLYTQQHELQKKLDAAERLILERARAGKLEVRGEFVPNRSNNNSDGAPVVIPIEYLLIDCLRFNLLHNQLVPMGSTDEVKRYYDRGRYDRIKIPMHGIEKLIPKNWDNPALGINQRVDLQAASFSERYKTAYRAGEITTDARIWADTIGGDYPLLPVQRRNKVIAAANKAMGIGRGKRKRKNSNS